MLQNHNNIKVSLKNVVMPSIEWYKTEGMFMGEKIHIKIQQGDNGITYAIKRQIIGYRLFVFLSINIYPLIFTPPLFTFPPVRGIIKDKGENKTWKHS